MRLLNKGGWKRRPVGCFRGTRGWKCDIPAPARGSSRGGQKSLLGATAGRTTHPSALIVQQKAPPSRARDLDDLARVLESVVFQLCAVVRPLHTRERTAAGG